VKTCVINKCRKFYVKIFLHYIDIVILALGYFILLRPVMPYCLSPCTPVAQVDPYFTYFNKWAELHILLWTLLSGINVDWIGLDCNSNQDFRYS